ncbi:PREDICTED: uncharacterized protein LOC109235819 [Nicotiana attenuata]|uniref:uncharacterized protein LOC109235819 n=1 Tax=Nicotiana attenuata TaxID=49451 RepID=UPI000904C384|nr:PREDICTED: uncharacterized protein LOC109235819 [Nicotiana attenuata]
MASSSLSLNAPQTFTGKNYQIWSVKMKSYLEAYDLWEVVMEDRPLEPLPANPTLSQIKNHSEEKTKKYKAKTVIQNSVADSIFSKIIECETTKEAWEKLKKEYQGSDRVRQMQILNLKRDFESLRMQEDETITRYSDRISSIVNRIRLLGKDFKDDRIVEKILVTVPEIFESKLSSLEESKDLSTISVAELISALQAQEQRRAFRQEMVSEGAFYAQNKKEKIKYPLCKYCKKKTHLEKFCWLRHDAICGICKQTGHVTKVCKFKDTQQNPQAQTAEAVIEEEQLF